MSGSIPEAVLDMMAEKFRTLSDPARLRILRTLLAGEKSVGQVVDETGQRQGNVSKHLKQLAGSGLIARRKEGLQVFYRVEDPLAEELCLMVCRTILRQAERQMKRDRDLVANTNSKSINS